MSSVVKTSKFRHLYGIPSTKDQAYDGVMASETRLESNIVSVNRKFIAVALQSSGGGTFTVLRRDKPGRVENVFRCIGHSSEIVDLSFDRFNVHRIVSGSDDGFYFVWWIPEDGLKADLEEVQCQLRNSQRRVVQSEWHPSAADILIGVNIDSITIFNVATAEIISSINTSLDNDQISNASINYNGTAIAASFKDKFVRVYDLMTREKITEFAAHEGSKPIKVAWITGAFDEDLLVTTGATRMSQRQICLWQISNPAEPVVHLDLNNASAAYNVFYDNDTRVLAFYGRGEYSITFYEVVMSDSKPGLLYLTLHKSSDPQRGLVFGNKLSCNFSANEVLHAVRILSKSLEEVAFVVPRRSDLFQDDLFPDSAGETPAMTAEDFIAGKKADPIKVSLKSFLPETTSQPSVTVRPVSCVQTSSDRISKVSFTSPPPPASNVTDEITALKAELAALQERVRVLEERE